MTWLLTVRCLLVVVLQGTLVDLLEGLCALGKLKSALNEVLTRLTIALHAYVDIPSLFVAGHYKFKPSSG